MPPIDTFILVIPSTFHVYIYTQDDNDAPFKSDIYVLCMLVFMLQWNIEKNLAVKKRSQWENKWEIGQFVIAESYMCHMFDSFITNCFIYQLFLSLIKYS